MKGKARISIILCIVVMSIPIPLGYISMSTENRVFVISDSDGPQFLDMGDMFADHTPSNNPVNGTLHLTVTIRDSDGIDTVIASFKNSSEASWSNLTMTYYSTVQEDAQIYYVDALEYTLDTNHRHAQWDVKFYANDTLGNWNVSTQIIYSAWLPSISDQNFGAIPVIVGGGVIVIIIIMYLKKIQRI